MKSPSYTFFEYMKACTFFPCRFAPRTIYPELAATVFWPCSHELFFPPRLFPACFSSISCVLYRCSLYASSLHACSLHACSRTLVPCTLVPCTLVPCSLFLACLYPARLFPALLYPARLFPALQIPASILATFEKSRQRFGSFEEHPKLENRLPCTFSHVPATVFKQSIAFI
jgi:hypothetical protein